MHRALLAACACLGCGRVAFDATRDGGSVDGTDDDAIGDSTVDACSSALCEGFEDVALAPVWVAMGDVVRDTAVFNRGTASMRFTIPTLAPNVGARSILQQGMTFTATPTVIYVRAYVRFGAFPNTNNQFPLIAVSEPMNGFENSLYVRDTSLAVYNQWSDMTRSDPMTPPTNTWLCLLWTVTRSTTATGSVVLGGDVAPAMLTDVVTDDVPALATMALGINMFSAGQPTNQPSLQVWLDDILVDDAPLTCAD